MTVADVKRNKKMSNDTIRDYNIQLLEDGWVEGYGWGGKTGYGARSGWTGGRLIMKQK